MNEKQKSYEIPEYQHHVYNMQTASTKSPEAYVLKFLLYTFVTC